MENIIKKILHEVVSRIEELNQKQHYKDRLKERLINKEKLEVRVVYFKENVGMRFKRVGEYRIPQEVKDIVQKKQDVMLSVDVDENIKLGVVIHRFRINASEIDFYDLDTKLGAMKLVVNNDAEFYLHDNETNSTGNVFFCIINDNAVITSYYTGSYSLRPEKYRVDKIIEVDDIWDFKV